MMHENVLFTYIQSVTGWKITGVPLLHIVPKSIKTNYEILRARIGSHDVIFAFVKHCTIDIGFHLTLVKEVEKTCNARVVLVFSSMGVAVKENLMAKRIAFVLPEEQIFIPFALMEISTPISKQAMPQFNPRTTALADLICVGILEKQIHSHHIFSAVARILHAELSLASKALHLLTDAKCLSIENSGRSKQIVLQDTSALFRFFLDRTDPVVKEYYYVSLLPPAPHFLTNYSALHALVDFAKPAITEVAITSARGAAKMLRAHEVSKENARYKVEVWDRDPALFAHGQCVNPLYLLRELRHDHRAIEAIQHLMFGTKASQEVRANNSAFLGQCEKSLETK